MDEIRQILGPTNQFKVRHIFWDDVENKSATRKNLSLRERLQRSIQRLFDRLQVPCSTEISYLSLGDLQVPAWEFDAQNIVAWAQEHQGKMRLAVWECVCCCSLFCSWFLLSL